VAAYRRLVSRRSWAFDVGVAAAVLVLGQLEAWWGVGASHRQGPVPVQAALYAVTAALLVLRRLHPLGVVVAMTVIYVVEFAAFGSPEGNGVALAPMVAIYSVGRYVDGRRSVLGLLLGVVLWAGWAAFDPLTHTWSERLGSVVWAAPWVIAWLVGVLVRTSRAAREQRASRAVAEERNRIARELHDVVGHSISVMTVQAAAVRRRLQPDQVVEREALETVESVGREALAEMRRMVGVLRQSGDGPDREPPPGLAQLDPIVEKFRAAGLAVQVTRTGTARDLTPGLDLTAYRIVQEGLTNTLRHAHQPSGAEVEIAYGPDLLQITVSDDGRASVPVPSAAHASGNGLAGMRERVAVYGGTLEAGPRPGGGFVLAATLPVEES
jgi:signal transduction histidine kinase